jgi:hypothetical protein
VDLTFCVQHTTTHRTSLPLQNRVQAPPPPLSSIQSFPCLAAWAASTPMSAPSPGKAPSRGGWDREITGAAPGVELPKAEAEAVAREHAGAALLRAKAGATGSPVPPPRVELHRAEARAAGMPAPHPGSSSYARRLEPWACRRHVPRSISPARRLGSWAHQRRPQG